MSLQQDLSKSSADAPNHSAQKKKVQTLMDSCAEKDAQREWQKRQNPQSVPPKKKPKQVQLSLTQKLIQCAQATTSVFYNHTPSKKSPLSRPSVMHSPPCQYILTLCSSNRRLCRLTWSNIYYLDSNFLFGHACGRWPNPKLPNNVLFLSHHVHPHVVQQRFFFKIYMGPKASVLQYYQPKDEKK
jgi:hypothetical protein